MPGLLKQGGNRLVGNEGCPAQVPGPPLGCLRADLGERAMSLAALGQGAGLDDRGPHQRMTEGDPAVGVVDGDQAVRFRLCQRRESLRVLRSGP